MLNEPSFDARFWQCLQLCWASGRTQPGLMRTLHSSTLQSSSCSVARQPGAWLPTFLLPGQPWTAICHEPQVHAMHSLPTLA